MPILPENWRRPLQSGSPSIHRSARLVLSSHSGYSKKLGSVFHRASAYWQVLLSAPKAKAAYSAASHTAAHKLGHQLLNLRTATSLGR
jgi:hypothetical protein